MTVEQLAGSPAAQADRVALTLKIGGALTLVGAVAFAVARALHGDTPGADAEASLNFVANRPIYAGVHIAAVFAALLSMAGPLAMPGALSHAGAWMLWRLGLASALVGLAIFGVDSTSEGLALPELARAATDAPSAEQRTELVGAARAVLAATHGPSLVAMALLYGLSLVLFGTALLLQAYPSWLGWAGIAVGGATLIAATGQFLQPDLMPGFLIYGILGSVLAQAWLVALAVVMLRRAGLRSPARQF